MRRLVALAVLLVVGYSLWRLGGVVVDAFGSSAKSPRGASGTTVDRSSVPRVEPPECSYGNSPAEQALAADWARAVLDTRLRLSSSYVPPDLVPVAQAGFRTSGMFRVRALVIPDLRALREAAFASGNRIDVVAAYRSYVQQASLFKRRKNRLGLTAARRKTARPGHSEHQLGTAVDFKTLGQVDVDVHWDSTPAGQWMLDNAWRFGFIQSYPRGKTAVTCYGYEPWHYRYVGRKAAAEVRASGLTLREFLWNRQRSS
jgi:D-alanyl-D-alanine carboxypeptidase